MKGFHMPSFFKIHFNVNKQQAFKQTKKNDLITFLREQKVERIKYIDYRPKIWAHPELFLSVHNKG